MRAGWGAGGAGGELGFRGEAGTLGVISSRLLAHSMHARMPKLWLLQGQQ